MLSYQRDMIKYRFAIQLSHTRARAHTTRTRDLSVFVSQFNHYASRLSAAFSPRTTLRLSLSLCVSLPNGRDVVKGNLRVCVCCRVFSHATSSLCVLQKHALHDVAHTHHYSTHARTHKEGPFLVMSKQHSLRWTHITQAHSTRSSFYTTEPRQYGLFLLAEHSILDASTFVALRIRYEIHKVFIQCAHCARAGFV